MIKKEVSNSRVTEAQHSNKMGNFYFFETKSKKYCII